MAIKSDKNNPYKDWSASVVQGVGDEMRCMNIFIVLLMVSWSFGLKEMQGELS